jgi:hypothetical protein
MTKAIYGHEDRFEEDVNNLVRQVENSDRKAIVEEDEE